MIYRMKKVTVIIFLKFANFAPYEQKNKTGGRWPFGWSG